MAVTILEGDVRERLADLPAASVQTVVTSPPYFGLRDYGVPGQIGLEPTLAEYVATLVAVFREVRRVLRDDGTVWLNLGDSYNSGPVGGFRPGAGRADGIVDERGQRNRNGTAETSLKPKDLMMVPARVALALQDDGWYLRSDIIWAKPNPMPESVTDRPTSAHEHIYLLTKRPRYYFDAEAVREDGECDRMRGPALHPDTVSTNGNGGLSRREPTGTRNIRNVWTIATHPFTEAHFATFPPAIPERCIKAGTSERGACPACGAPWVRCVERVDTGIRQKMADGWDTGPGSHGTVHRNGREIGQPDVPVMAAVTTGWRAGCSCDAGAPVPQTVLDPFAGAGTTLLVADRLGRDAIGIELNPGYAAMARRRIVSDAPLFADVS